MRPDRTYPSSGPCDHGSVSITACRTKRDPEHCPPAACRRRKGCDAPFVGRESKSVMRGISMANRGSGPETSLECLRDGARGCRTQKWSGLTQTSLMARSWRPYRTWSVAVHSSSAQRFWNGIAQSRRDASRRHSQDGGRQAELGLRDVAILAHESAVVSLPQGIAAHTDNRADEHSEERQAGLPQVEVVVALEDHSKGLPIVSAADVVSQPVLPLTPKNR